MISGAASLLTCWLLARFDRMALTIRLKRWSVITFAAMLLPLVACAADLQITVSDGPSEPATLYLALFDTAEAYTTEKAVASQKTEMRDGTAQIIFKDLPAGRYAIKSFADVNGNANLDKNIIGLPTERYGFSNNAQGRMGPPSFDAAAIQVEGASVTALRLR